jgi:HEAT repeat protein/rhodanese-related sulfurtransferase
MSHGQGDLCFAYWGSAEKLRERVAAMLAGREVVVTALQRSPDNSLARGAVFQNLPRGAAFPVWRVKASLKMPAFAYRLGKDHVVGMGAGGKEDVPPLVKALREGDRRARAEAAEELGLIGPAATAGLPALREAGKDAAARARVSATLALALIDPKEADAAVPTLAAALKDGAAGMRAAAAAALGELGPAGGKAVPELTKALGDGDLKVRWASADALGRIGPGAKAAIPALVGALKDEQPSLRALAAQALGEIGRDGGAKDAEPALAKGLRDPERHVRRQAAWALAKVGAAGAPEAGEAVKVLTEGLTDPWEWGATLAVLVRFRADSVPALADALKRGNVEVRKAAANLFLQLSPGEYRSAVPTLTDALKGPDGYVRFRCAVALMHVGPEAKAALPRPRRGAQGRVEHEPPVGGRGGRDDRHAKGAGPRAAGGAQGAVGRRPPHVRGPGAGPTRPGGRDRGGRPHRGAQGRERRRPHGGRRSPQADSAEVKDGDVGCPFRVPGPWFPDDGGRRELPGVDRLSYRSVCRSAHRASAWVSVWRAARIVRHAGRTGSVRKGMVLTTAGVAPGRGDPIVLNTPQTIDRLWDRGQPRPYDEVIDARSTGEFAEDHLPGAVNLPVLSDIERAEVGTIYHQIGAFEARRDGAALVSRNIARHLAGHLADKGKDYRPLVYCWRGGMRSHGFATVLAAIGWGVTVLAGGYKTYRARHPRTRRRPAATLLPPDRQRHRLRQDPPPPPPRRPRRPAPRPQGERI